MTECSRLSRTNHQIRGATLLRPKGTHLTGRSLDLPTDHACLCVGSYSAYAFPPALSGPFDNSYLPGSQPPGLSGRVLPPLLPLHRFIWLYYIPPSALCQDKVPKTPQNRMQLRFRSLSVDIQTVFHSCDPFISLFVQQGKKILQTVLLPRGSIFLIWESSQWVNYYIFTVQQMLS